MLAYHHPPKNRLEWIREWGSDDMTYHVLFVLLIEMTEYTLLIQLVFVIGGYFAMHKSDLISVSCISYI